MKNPDPYRQGRLAYHRNKRYRDCPYPQGSSEHQAWVNGFGDAGDKDFLKLVKFHPSILINK